MCAVSLIDGLGQVHGVKLRACEAIRGEVVANEENILNFIKTYNFWKVVGSNRSLYACGIILLWISIQGCKLLSARGLCHEFRIMNYDRFVRYWSLFVLEEGETIGEDVSAPANEFLREACDSDFFAVIAKELSGHAGSPPVLVFDGQGASIWICEGTYIGVMDKTISPRFQLVRELGEVGANSVAFHVDKGVPAEGKIDRIIRDHGERRAVIGVKADVVESRKPFFAVFNAYFCKVNNAQV
jgi:hypothetical protein